MSDIHTSEAGVPRSSRTSRWWRWFRRLGFALVALLAGFLVLVAYANVTAIWAARGRIFADVAAVPATEVGVVFGTSDRVAGRENLYFRYRIEAANEVWKAGKVKTLIVSGVRSSRYYDEPSKMRLALIGLGVPADRIVCDEGGVRTLDSVVRAKEVFGVNEVLFISQRFQDERAIYLANAYGIHAHGFAARDVESHEGLKTKLREIGARVKMWLDVNCLNTRPVYPSRKIALPR